MMIWNALGRLVRPVAAGMCEGLLPMGATHGVAVTGIAGPSGGTAGRPVGTVCFGVLYGGGDADDDGVF